MEKTIDELGYQGPIILTIISASQLWRQTPYFIVYLAGFYLNKQLNEFLKNVIKEPRPKPFDLKAAQERDWFKWFKGPVTDSNGIYISKAHLYGMPSGHAEAAAYAITFYYLSNKKKIQSLQQVPMNKQTGIFLIMLFLYSVTIYQRWNTREHTPAQLFVGTLVGMLVAGALYMSISFYLQTKTDVFNEKKII